VRKMTLSVLQVCRTYYPETQGGVEQAIRQIATSTKNHGIKSCVFTLSRNCNPVVIKESGVEVIRSKSIVRLWSCDVGGLRSLWHFARVARKFDVVHYHFPWPFADLLHFLVRPKVATVLTYHSDVIRQQISNKIYQFLGKFMLRDMDQVIVTSPEYAKGSPLLSAVDFQKTPKIIPLGVSDECFMPTQQQCDQRTKKYGIDQPFFLFVGVLRYYKGLWSLLEAALTYNGLIVIAGSGPEESRLKEYATRNNLSNVIFIGTVSESDKVILMRGCIGLVLPSNLRAEAFGMVLVEASMLSKPMITCEIGTGTTFVNIKNVTGLVVPPNCPSALANAMFKLSSSSKLARRMGEAARERYLTLFTSERLGYEYTLVYRNVVAEYQTCISE